MKPKVALTSGQNRSENVAGALDLIKDDIDLTDKKDIFIKVNFVDPSNQVTATHIDGVRPLIKFLRSRYNGPIRIGESHIHVPIREAFETFGFMDTLNEYDVEIVEMKDDAWETLHLYNADFEPMDIHYSKTMLQSDYLISIGPPKTHDMVVVTLSIKNVVMGGPSHKYDDKMKIHQGPPVMNLDLYLMAIEHIPDLAILDGFEAMEGDGPVGGTPVDWKVAVASCDAVTADVFTADLMGFPLHEIGYLTYLVKKGYGAGKLQDMDILGEDPEKHRMKFKPHSTCEWQKTWPDARVNSILGI